VVPISDPEIFSELQRIAQMQTIAQRAHSSRSSTIIQGRDGILKMMKVKDPTQYLNPKPTPKPQHAVNENIAAALGSRSSHSLTRTTSRTFRPTWHSSRTHCSARIR